MGQRFTIEGPLPALNAILNASKTHWSTYKRERDEAMAKARLFIRAARLEPFDAHQRLWITTVFYAKDRRTDPSNLSAGFHKVVEDALQLEGILPNDGYGNIAGYTEHFRVDRARPRFEIELSEVI